VVGEFVKRYTRSVNSLTENRFHFKSWPGPETIEDQSVHAELGIESSHRDPNGAKTATRNTDSQGIDLDGTEIRRSGASAFSIAAKKYWTFAFKGWLRAE
jgi:hypothetical protein